MTETHELGTFGVSMKLQEGEGKCVSTFRQLRDQAGYTSFKLAVDANVSLSTINRLEGTAKDNTVTTRKANQVLSVLGEKLKRSITIDDVEGLRERVKDPPSRKKVSDGEHD